MNKTALDESKKIDAILRSIINLAANWEKEADAILENKPYSHNAKEKKICAQELFNFIIAIQLSPLLNDNPSHPQMKEGE